jgi:hypothetical protein
MGILAFAANRFSHLGVFPDTVALPSRKEDPRLSHIVSIKTELRDREAVASACQRLGLPEPIHGTAEIFATEASGLIVQLPDWHYPVVVDVATGQVQYDNYNGHWGDRAHLDRFLQIYAVQKTQIEARKRGYSVVEQPLADGSIRVRTVVGGGA